MKLYFTLCSNNYLAQARVWAASVKRVDPESRVVLGLVDERNSAVDYSWGEWDEMWALEDLKLPNLNLMLSQYEIVEFNTSVKPFYFQRLLEKFPDVESVTYMDPDTLVYTPLSDLKTSAPEGIEIHVTPHAVTPIPFNFDSAPTDLLFIRCGLYNLGFLEVKRGTQTDAMLAWWAERLFTGCVDDVSSGYFVDQLWMNLAPVYFTKVWINRDRGMNISWWNLHERTLEQHNGRWIVTETGEDLKFFHFSSFDMSSVDRVRKLTKEINVLRNPMKDAMRPLFEDYRDQMRAAGYEDLIKIPWAWSGHCLRYDKGWKKKVKSVLGK